MSISYQSPVLIVDDVPMMQEIITAVARMAGFDNVDVVATGQAALACLKQKKYELVISDLEMEEMSGLDLLRHVRSDDSLKHIRFIMISAHKRSDFVTAAAERGADCFIVKPFSPADLQKKIETVCTLPKPFFKSLRKGWIRRKR